jgi:hypothetical protein
LSVVKSMRQTVEKFDASMKCTFLEKRTGWHLVYEDGAYCLINIVHRRIYLKIYLRTDNMPVPVATRSKA